MKPTQWFLFIYDRRADRLHELIEYGTNQSEALRAYSATELQYLHEPWMDIVLIGAESLDTIKVTHSTYFDGGVRALIEQSFARVKELCPA